MDTVSKCEFDYTFNDLRFKNSTLVFSWSFKRIKNVFNFVRNYNTSYRISSDFDFLIRVFKNNKLQKKFIYKTIILMRSGGISSQFKYAYNRIREDLKILRKYYPKQFIIIFLAKLFNKFIQLLK